MDRVRFGRVDISLSQEFNGWKVPCAVVENKSYVRLEKKYKDLVRIVQSDWDKVSEDVRRNIALMESCVGGVITNTASTFYVSNNYIVVQSEAVKFLADLEQEVARLMKISFYNVLDSNAFSLQVDAFEVEGEYYENREAAEAIVDESGCPEYVAGGVWFLAGVIVSLSQ